MWSLWRMRLQVVLFIALPFFAACAPRPDNSSARKERIIEHVRERYRDLAHEKLELSDFARIGGMDHAVLTLRGKGGRYTVLALPDDTRVYVIAQEPIDATLSAADLLAARDKRRQDNLKRLTELGAGKPVRGNPAAPVMVVAFSDFQCAYCRRAATIVDELIARHPQQAKLVFMHFPLDFNDWALPAAIAAECAAAQHAERFWTLHDGYFKEQESLSAANLLAQSKNMLAKLAIDVKAWEACASAITRNNKVVLAIETEMQTATDLGVDGAPTFFIDGELYSGLLALEDLEEGLRQALVRRP